MEGRRGHPVSTRDDLYLARACELAARSTADAAPNPSVGCVLVRDGTTLGEGWHHRKGDAHAEVEALRDAARRGYDVGGATAYVTLEPCNHAHRTPPCAQALVEAGVTRAVIGAPDPDPRTAASGLRRLREANVEVVLADDPRAASLLAPFRVLVAQSERPYVTLKMAQSLDGYVAARAGTQQWLTGAAARERVRELRAEHQAVMVGAGTVRVDDPLLTVRPHRTRARPYVRVVACERDPVPLESRVLRDPPDAPLGAYARTIVLAPAGARARFAALAARCDVVFAGPDDAAELDLRAALGVLRSRGVETVLCEGGPTLAARLLAARLVDRAVWFIAPVLLHGPGAVPVLRDGGLAPDGWRFARSERVGDDLMVTMERTCSAV